MNPAKILRSVLAFGLIVISIQIFPPVSAFPFYEHQKGESTIDMRGLFRAYGIAERNPEDDVFYDDRRDVSAAALGRLLVEAQSGEQFGFEFNAYQAYIPASLISNTTLLDTPLDTERSDALEWSFSNHDFVRLAVDRLNVRGSFERLDLTLGRQAVNLATTYYFTPNDFFAPFAAQTFYRVYKPGVDAARAEVLLSSLSQLSLISVLGYTPDPKRDTGWSSRPDGDRTSLLGRVSAVFHDIEWALLGGTVREVQVIGGSMQGELFQWLGVRAEGHYADPDDRASNSDTEIAVGIEHRWANSLELRLEQFYHGGGAASVDDYSVLPAAGTNNLFYLGKRYSAVGGGYEFTPLLNGELLAMTNWTDHSWLVTCNLLYSLSDETELSFRLGLPLGKKPKGAEIRSEFGLYPYSLLIEIRSYF